jgi:DNA polymerase-3 subunit beta
VKFRCERDTLLEALLVTSRAVTSRGVPTAMSGLLLELEGSSLKVTGSDPEHDLVIEASVDVFGTRAGRCVPPAQLFCDIVRSLEPGAVVVEAADEEFRLTGGHSQFTLNAFDPSEYLVLPGVDSGEVRLDARELVVALRQVARAAASDRDKAEKLAGVLFAGEEDKLSLVATDSYRLALREVAGVEGEVGGLTALVPAVSLNQLQRLLASLGADVAQVALRTAPSFAVFEIGQYTVRTRLIEQQFPVYRDLIPATSPNRLTVPRESFIDAVRRTSLVVRGSVDPLRLVLSTEGVRLLAERRELGRAEEDVDGKYEGEELTIGLNPAFLVDGLEGATTEEVVIEVVNDAKPVVVRGLGVDDYVYLLMPVRIAAGTPV